MSALSQCLNEEANAIFAASKNLNEGEVEKALSILEKCSLDNGKLVITGVGKSGIVARKISATFSSIGLMSIFLNPLDALHGDLGIVAKNDVCIMLSNSGETSELLHLVPHLKRREIPIISILGKKHSSLSEKSFVILEAKVDREMCPLNLAPTASTAVSMAIGDALAVVWMERMGISSEIFALNHPAGSLGKQLTMTALDLILPAKELQNLYPSSSFSEVISSLTKGGSGSVLVEDEEKEGKLVGIVTDGDLRRSLKKYSPNDWSDLKAFDLMTRSPIYIYQDVLVADALKKMESNEINRSISVLPVLETTTDKILGLLRLHDIIKSGFV